MLLDTKQVEVDIELETWVARPGYYHEAMASFVQIS